MPLPEQPASSHGGLCTPESTTKNQNLGQFTTSLPGQAPTSPGPGDEVGGFSVPASRMATSPGLSASFASLLGA
jgi:hypothetical protein